MPIFNLFGKKDAGNELIKGSPYRISSEWVPYKLYSGRRSSAMLIVKVKNATKEILLTSIILELPQQLGLDDVGMIKERELRIGDISPGEERELKFDVYGGIKTDPGEYTVTLTAMAHYRDYGHVINAVKKRTTLSVV